MTSVVIGAALLAGAYALKATDAPKAADDPSVLIGDILASTAIRTRLSAWGLSVVEVQLDVDAMSVPQQQRLLQVLTRPWPAAAGYDEADLRAQYLVTVSLLRESTLFADILRTSR